MKKLLLLCCICLGATSATLAQLHHNKPPSIYTTKVNTVFVDDFIQEDKNPIRQGIDGFIQNKIGGIFRPQKITDFATAKDTTIAVVHMFINYALGLLSLIALIYLIVHGIIVLTAGADGEKYKKGLSAIKTAAIALAGIGLSWLIVSFVFWIINAITQ